MELKTLENQSQRCVVDQGLNVIYVVYLSYIKENTKEYNMDLKTMENQKLKIIKIRLVTKLQMNFYPLEIYLKKLWLMKLMTQLLYMIPKILMAIQGVQ